MKKENKCNVKPESAAKELEWKGDTCRNVSCYCFLPSNPSRYL